MKKVLAVSMMVLSAAVMSACATGGANQSVGADAMGRTIPERISDSSIELTARRNLATVPGIDANNVRIAIDSYRREVLLTGEVPSEQIKVEVGRTIESMRDVAKVYNYLTVTETPRSQSHTVQENYLRTKINARLLTDRNIKSSQFKVIVRDRTAYVMGYMTPDQQVDILNAVQATPGIEMAVTLTTLVTDGQVTSLPNDTSAADQGGTIYGGEAAAPVAAPSSDAYTLQEIYTPEASTTAPINTVPVFQPAQ
ncbi:BON domain-containing protein [Moraxella sp. FZFQ2102]|uniref:BON domain-containing protein n=1 Tax=Moraxella sp. FZFQ2102 TaxID=2953752 RepID=UPI00209C276B|nr:BON domain-containing protein [Moraxella sp. FZFQ2102]USZ15624.1 BON domain-containing protein [Moraxella sp. FZFQ2102]